MKRALLLVLASHAAAADDFTATPYLHINAGDVEIRRGGLGGALGYTHRWFGVELDVDRHEHFYKDKDLAIPNACIPGVSMGPCIDDNTDAWLASASAVAMRPLAPRWTLYGTAGAGLVHAWIHGAGPYDGTQNHAIASLGGGVTYRITPWLGLRADLRFFHAFVDEGSPDGGYTSDYDWGRFSLGVTFSGSRGRRR